MSLWSQISDKILGSPQSLPLEEEQIKQVLRQIIDPDLHQDIVSLGFVKNIQITSDGVSLILELTTPACPVKEKLKAQTEELLLKLPGVHKVSVTITSQARKTNPAAETMVAALAEVKQIIAIAAGKGGVGKSTTAVQLAFALSKAGAKVGLLDADVYGPSIPLMTAPQVLPSQAPDESKVEPLDAHGVKVMSIGFFAQGNQAHILRGPMAGNVVKQFLTHVNWGPLDYLLIDYPPGTGDIQLTISQTVPLSGALLVSTPQAVATADVRKALKMFTTLKVPLVGIIENMSYFLCDGCEKKHFIFGKQGGNKLAEEYGIPLLGQIPLYGELVSSSDTGQPLVWQNESHPAAQAYIAAAGEMVRQVSILSAKDGGALSSFSLVWRSL